MALDNETLKWASLVIFTLQNAAFVLLMRASKVRVTHTHTHRDTGTRAHAYSFFILSPQVYGSNYNSTVAVLVTEVLKLPLTVALLCYEKCSVTAAGGQLWKDIAMQPMDTWRTSSSKACSYIFSRRSSWMLVSAASASGAGGGVIASI